MPSQIAAGSAQRGPGAGRSALSYPRPRNADVQHIYDRVSKIAEGAALMPKPRLNADSTKPVPVISRIALRKCHVPGPIPFWYPGMELQELAFAKQIQATLTPNDRQNV